MSRSGNILLGTVFGAVLAAALVGGLTLVVQKSPKIDVAAVQKELAPLAKDSEESAKTAAIAETPESSSVTAAPSEIKILTPQKDGVWQRGQTYKLEWTGGGEKVNIFLINKQIAEEVGASVSASERLYGLENSGSYEYTVPKVLTEGTYQWHIFDMSGNAIGYSDYFEIR